MTLNQLVDISDTPREIIFLVLRSIYQREIATPEGVTASMMVWERQHGEVTWPKVLYWVDSLKHIKDLEIPNSFLEEILDADL